VLLTGAERLDERGHDRLLLGLRLGDPQDEVLGAWLAKENVRRTSRPPGRTPGVVLDKTIAGCLADPVPEVRSLGKTVKPWRAEILAHHTTGTSNGPTEGLNLCVKKVKRCGHDLRTFEHDRLRVLLHAGGVAWPRRPRPPRFRTRAPYSTRRARS
jgi:transposase